MEKITILFLSSLRLYRHTKLINVYANNFDASKNLLTSSGKLAFKVKVM